MLRKHILIFMLMSFIYGCATLPSVTAPKLDKVTFLDMTDQESVIALFRISEKGKVSFDKLVTRKPNNLMATYAKNKALSESGNKKTKYYRDCIVLRRNRSHQSCSNRPIKGSVLVKNEVTGAGLIAGAIMSPFIIFEAALLTLTGNTKKTKEKIQEFDGATEPKFDQRNIQNIGDTILKELTHGYANALRNGTEKGYLIAISRTHDETLSKARKVSLRKTQQFLKHQNLYLGNIDGIMGNQTRQALITFQKQQRIEPTGKLDTTTKIALSNRFEATEFNYLLASRQNTIAAYKTFIAENPSSEHITEATKKKNKMVAVKREKDAEISRQKRIARQEKLRKQQAAQRKKILTEISNARWERGDLAHVCRKKFWNLFSDWETCDARVLEVTNNKAHIEFKWGCGVGWQQGDTEWVDLAVLKPRDDCDSYMHLLD